MTDHTTYCKRTFTGLLLYKVHISLRFYSQHEKSCLKRNKHDVTVSLGLQSAKCTYGNKNTFILRGGNNSFLTYKRFMKVINKNLSIIFDVIFYLTLKGCMSLISQVIHWAFVKIEMYFVYFPQNLKGKISSI